MQYKEAALQGEIGDLKSINSELKAEVGPVKAKAIEWEYRLKREAIERERAQTKGRSNKVRKEIKEELVGMLFRSKLR